MSENVTQGPPDHSNGNGGSSASSSMRVGSTEDGLNRGEAGAKSSLGLASAPNESSSTIAPLRIDSAEDHLNRGVALKRRGDLDGAVTSYKAAIWVRPGYFEAHANLGNVLTQQGKLDAAIASYRLALTLNPKAPTTHNNLANALRDRGMLAEAVESYGHAIALEPTDPLAHYNLGNALQSLGRAAEAISAYGRALELEPDLPFALGQIIYLLQARCAWSEWSARRQSLIAALAASKEAANPFVLLGCCDDPKLQLEAARCFGARLQQASGSGFRASWHDRGRRRDRMRIGYLSADLHEHATSRLIAEVLELHDRTAFEIVAYSYGPDDGSAMRLRVRQACDAFHDGKDLPLADAARRVDSDRIDILVDLKGYTKSSRSQILAMRPAPVQVNWLGFPGTMGAPFVDYIVADAFIIPTSHERFYSEKIVRLPGTYQPNDRRRAIGSPASRAECGLPTAGFVFCSFNQSFKILPKMFAAWMRILGSVPDSVLWLLERQAEPSHALRREAEEHGVAPERLIFAASKPVEQHLARLRLADLALDTFPYTSHTTGSDALWAGCPLLTLVGDTFASRVAGSLLSAAGLPEMITASLAEFEQRAIHFARRPDELARLRARLAADRDRCALFDTPRFTRNLEAAYRKMFALWASGRSPENISIAPEPRPAATAGDARLERTTPSVSVGPPALSAEHYLNRGAALRTEGKLEEAKRACEKAIELRPDYAEAHANLGNVLTEIGRRGEAISAYRRALRLKPDAAMIHNNLGNALRSAGQLEEAAQSYRRALALDKKYVAAHINLGNVLRDQGRLDEAVESCQRALALDPESPEAYNNLGSALQSQGRAAEAADALWNALRLKPAYPRAYNNLGNSLRDQGKFAEAVECYRKAVALEPGYANAYYNLGLTLKGAVGVETITYFEKAVELDPSHQGALQELVHQLQHLCDWDGWRRWWPVLLAQIEERTKAFVPFPLLSQPVSAQTQQRVAAGFARQITGGSQRIAERETGAGSRARLRIGYLSADFHQHATSRLLAEALELHDRRRFEIVAYSYGPDDESGLRDRIRAACSSFNDLSALSFSAMSETIRKARIDILVDLKGYTKDTRSQILAHRPAPVQVNWLGYPGTMGAPFVDYIIADSFIIPPDFERHYTEKVVRLPGTYQPNDRHRRIGPVPPRAASGLPLESFVFCCFNQTYKILPDMFAAWMRILGAVPDSVMWLLERSRESSDNLRRAAAALGIAPERLVFGKHIPSPDHLSRYRSADLALDTFPCTSHTTASDALWAGCPLLTLAGETFASRVAGSVLHAGGLPELVTATLDDYVRLATELATERKRLAALRDRLSANRASCALFDTPRFVANLERAYSAMWEAHEARRPPAPIDLSGST